MASTGRCVPRSKIERSKIAEKNPFNEWQLALVIGVGMPTLKATLSRVMFVRVRQALLSRSDSAAQATRAFLSQLWSSGAWGLRDT